MGISDERLCLDQEHYLSQGGLTFFLLLFNSFSVQKRERCPFVCVCVCLCVCLCMCEREREREREKEIDSGHIALRRQGGMLVLQKMYAKITEEKAEKDKN